MEAEVKRRKRRVVLVALAACLVVAGIGGTLAWFSAQSQLTNTFTVGKITDPTTKPGTEEAIPDSEKPDKLNGNLYEPSWVKDSKIGPGANVAKDPYVGIGKDSEPAYVYVYVKSNLPEGAYFTIESGWEAVDAKMVQGTTDQYTGGLFAYASNYNQGAGLTKLEPTGNPAKDAWTTTPLFRHIKAGKDYVTTDIENVSNPKNGIVVSAYVAAESKTGDSLADLDAAAKAWAAERAGDPTTTTPAA